MPKEDSLRVHRREDIVTGGIAVKDIDGLVLCERPNFRDELKKLGQMARATANPEETFAETCNLFAHIEVPIDYLYEYAANVYSLEEFTATVRNIEYLGGGVYKGVEGLAPNTSIFIKIEAHRESYVIDTMCAWDQAHELWMRYHWRLFDAQTTIGKPGTVLQWSNFRHPYYDPSKPAPSYVAEPRARTDRRWVGEFWPLFYAAHKVEADNLKTILERRFRR